MRIIIEIDNQSNQPSVQMHDSKDTDMINTTVSAVNAIDAGAPNLVSNETTSEQTLNNSFNGMNAGGTSAGAAPTF
jgi:hypothetical protein